MLQLPLPFFKNRAEKGDAYEKFLLDTNCSVAQRYHHHHNFKKEKIIMKKAIYRFTSPARNFCTKAGQYLRNQRGDFYISDGVKIIIAVVLGALLNHLPEPLSTKMTVRAFSFPHFMKGR